MAKATTTKFQLRARSKTEKLVDVGFKNFVSAMASILAIVLISIFSVVYYESSESISRYGLRFLFSSAWNPVTDEYGAFTAIYGTLFTSLASLLIAIPLGVGTAIFITENIIPKYIRDIIGIMVELLAAIPSVVLGLWAIFIMEPFIRPFLNIIYEIFGFLPFLALNQWVLE